MKALGFGAALAANRCARANRFRQGLEDRRHWHERKRPYEPWNLTDFERAEIVGFEPDLIMDVCKRAGLECKIIAQDWDGMVPGLKAGKFDVIMDGMSITDERKKESTSQSPTRCRREPFSRRRIARSRRRTAAGTLVNLDKDAAAGDAAIKGVAGGAQGQDARRASLNHPRQFRHQYLKGVADVKEYKTIDDRDLDLKSGRIDASLDDYPAMVATAEKPDAKDLAVVGQDSSAACSALGQVSASARVTRI